MTIEQAYNLLGKHVKYNNKRAEVVAIIHDPDAFQIFADLRYPNKQTERVHIEKLVTK